MEQMNILILDVGSTSMRGVLFRSDGKILCTNSVQTPHRQEGRLHEQSPIVLTNGLMAICRQSAVTDKIHAVALTAFRSAPTIVNKHGEALCSFIMWQDTRSEEICQELRSQCDDLPRRCGAPLSTLQTATKLTYLRRHQKEVYRRGYKFLVVPDYLLHCMTGNFVTDRTYGSRSLLMELEADDWDQELCRRFEVDREKLCPLVPPGTIIGQVTPAFNRLTGLPSGLPVITAGGDQQCAAFGNGILDSSSLLINSGTGAYLLSCLETPPEVQDHVICNTAAIPGRYLVETSVSPCAHRLNTFLANCYPELQGSHSKLDDIVTEVYYGQRKNDARAQSACGLYQSLAAAICTARSRLPLCCQQAERIYLSGGLSQSAIYNQILADTAGRTLYRWRNVQSTAIGAFASAAVTLALFPDYLSALKAVRAYDSCDLYHPH